VYTVELKDDTGRVPVQFDILPLSGVSAAVVQAQLEIGQQLAPLGTRYYFLVTTDWVRGWRVEDGAPVFELPTATLFAGYADNDAAKIRGAGPHYLAELTQAWLADLTYHWRSRGVTAPGEHDMQLGGVLGLVRSAATATTANV
jgi:hypothetical protein